jgi:hypothetical protein
MRTEEVFYYENAANIHGVHGFTSGRHCASAGVETRFEPRTSALQTYGATAKQTYLALAVYAGCITPCCTTEL